MNGDGRVDEVAAQRPQPRQRALLVRAREPAVADHVSGEDRGKLPPEIYFVLAGTGVMTLDGREIAVKAGSAVFIPGMAEHGVRQTGAERMRFFYGFPVDSFDDVEYLFTAANSA